MQVVGLVLAAVYRAIGADAILTAMIGVAAAALVVVGSRWLAGHGAKTGVVRALWLLMALQAAWIAITRIAVVGNTVVLLLMLFCWYLVDRDT
jgi:hypothetical protein